MLDVKISGSPEEIAALFRQLAAGSTTYNVSGESSLRVGGDLVAIDTKSELRAPLAPIAAADLPDAGGVHASDASLAAFGAAPAPQPETNLSVFGGAPAPAPAPPLPNDSPLPAPAAPPTPPAGVTSTPAGTELDKNGLPWDQRIHSESKAKNADQTWRMKRNLAPELKASVEAELRTLMAHPAPSTLPPPPPAAADPAGTAPPPPPPPPAASVDFASIFQRCTAAVASNVFTQEQLATMLTRVTGSPMLPLLINRQDLFAVVDQNLTAMGA